MNRFHHPYLLLLICLSIFSSCGKSRETDFTPASGISWSSILGEATDPDTMISPIQDWEQSLHFSSSATTNKVMLANLAPEILGDMDHGFFLKIEEQADGVDATLAEVRGKGMISWIWSANPSGTLRLFIDNESIPVVEMPFEDFLEGKFLPTAYPFAALTAHGYNLHFPILHANYCKLVVRMRTKKDLSTLFYQVAWNAIDPAQPVHPWALDDLSRGATRLDELARAMQHTMKTPEPAQLKTIPILAGQKVDLFESSTEGTLTHIWLRTDTKEELASLQFAAVWDGETSPRLECPLYMLAGVSERMEDVRSLPVTVQDSSVSVRWPMPYGSVRLSITNKSAAPIRLAYHIQATSTSSPLRLGGQYKNHLHLRTDQHNVLTLADLSGEGRWAGCNLQVKSRSQQWWGEGDQLIYLDSIDHPTWQGTGTEDYFGFAWCSRTPFDHAFRGQSAVWDTPQGRISAMHRYHFLDRLPFHHEARFCTEAWGLSEGSMDHESLVLYYQEQ
jgi:hypothetical protein